MQRILLEQKRIISNLERELSETEERLIGAYCAYEELSHTLERRPSQHDLLTRDRKIAIMENFLDANCQGWKFKLKQFEEEYHVQEETQKERPQEPYARQ